MVLRELNIYKKDNSLTGQEVESRAFQDAAFTTLRFNLGHKLQVISVPEPESGLPGRIELI